MLLLPTEAMIEWKMNTCRLQTDAVPHTNEDHKLFKKILIHAS